MKMHTNRHPEAKLLPKDTFSEPYGMVGLPDGEKNFENIYSRLCTIPACDKQTDRQTDKQTDGGTDRWTDTLPRHSPRYAYASRGKNRKMFIPHPYLAPSQGL